MSKDSGTAKIEPMAEVKMGHVTARFTTKALEDLYYLKDFVEKDLLATIREFDDMIIDAYRENNAKAAECMKRLDGLRGYVWWFERVKEIDMTWESEKLKIPTQ